MAVTIYATTSTVSDDANHDQGADPNQVLTITIPVGATASTTPTRMARLLSVVDEQI